MNEIVVVDYGLGNLRSVLRGFNRIGCKAVLTEKKNEILAADKIVLPGVGHFKTGMKKIKDLGLDTILTTKVIEQKTPILGICLGLQLFCKSSEEGNVDGLGWVDAEVRKFRVNDKTRYKVPHMGWNDVKVENSNLLNANINDDELFYFVHSYHLECNEKKDIWLTTEYEYNFVSAIKKDNIYGTQFHPEKSQDAGIQILKNFVSL